MSSVHSDSNNATRTRTERLMARFWCLYSWPVTIVWVLVTGSITMLLPGRSRRRWFAGRAARGLCRLVGIRVKTLIREPLPTGGCIVAANHASFLDGLVLTAVLPPRFSFVIKREVTRVPFVSLLLRRLDSLFVDRFNSQAVVRDANKMLKRARLGEAIGIFPEGTFGPNPGLRPFRAGAFLAAVRANLPVVPISIRGARRCLPAGTVSILPGRVEVEIHEAIVCERLDREARFELSGSVRQRILSALDEPDLAA